MRLIDLYPVLPDTIKICLNGKILRIDKHYHIKEYGSYEVVKVDIHSVLDAWVIRLKG